MTSAPKGMRDLRERAFTFAGAIVHLCTALDAKPGTSRTLAAQLLRAGTAIGAKIEGAQAAESRADFVHKYAIALKEARATLYWLRVCSRRQRFTLVTHLRRSRLKHTN